MRRVDQPWQAAATGVYGRRAGGQVQAVTIFALTFTPNAGENAGRMATVLVVDDDPAARKPLARLLQMEGHEVVCAENAVMAMAAALGRRPDLILLDVAIPPMDGLTFLFLLREKPAGKEVPVIVISGMEDARTQQRARELGVTHYLVKSQYKTRELLDLVRGFCLRSEHLPNSEDVPTTA